MSFRSRRLAIIALVLASVVCIRLGFWQLGRLQQRRAANEVAAADRRAPAVRLERGMSATAESLADHWLTATGEYDFEHEIVLRGQAYQGSPGVHLVTPLLLGRGDTAVLVNRGFVPAADAVRAETDSLREPGEVRVTGLAQAIGSGNGKPLHGDGRTTWARLDLEALGSALPYPILPVVIRQSPDTALPRLPRRLAAPELSDGPHLNYAIQWFLFAGLSLGFIGVVLTQGRSSRRAP